MDDDKEYRMKKRATRPKLATEELDALAFVDAMKKAVEEKLWFSITLEGTTVALEAQDYKIFDDNSASRMRELFGVGQVYKLFPWDKECMDNGFKAKLRLTHDEEAV